MANSESKKFAQHSDRWRLMLLLDACEAANLCPIPVMRLHAVAFLANVLAPVWSAESYDGKILKRSGGPYYPELQIQLDRLIGLGFVIISDVSHIEEDGRWRLAGSFSLNPDLTPEIFFSTKFFKEEKLAQQFLRRLAFAVSRLSQPVEKLVQFDATWSDARTGTGDVVDFSEWRRANYSAFTAQFFEEIAPIGLGTTAGDKLQMYMRLLERKALAS